MPQAPQYLRDEFADDGVALEVIAENFTVTRGLIQKKSYGYIPTPKENHAIDYLWLEWDYAYLGSG